MRKITTAVISLTLLTSLAHSSAFGRSIATPSAMESSGPLINSVAPPGLLYGADLGKQSETYADLHNFWDDDIISHFFKMAADGSLNQAQSLVNDLCNRWNIATLISLLPVLSRCRRE
jgi:hypothetical protein